MFEDLVIEAITDYTAELESHLSIKYLITKKALYLSSEVSLFG
jgi:hypothetical protein